MNEQTIKLIQELAAKFGTTAEKLWSVLIKQGPISGFTNLIVLILYFAAALRLFKWIKATDFLEDDGKTASFFILAITSAVVAVIAVCCMEGIVASIVHPEFWALSHFIK